MESQRSHLHLFLLRVYSTPAQNHTQNTDTRHRKLKMDMIPDITDVCALPAPGYFQPLRYFQHEQGWKESPWSYISWHALYCISAKEIICPTQESLNSKRYVNIKSCTIPNKFFEQKTGRLASVRANNPFCRRHGYRGNNQYLPNTLAGHGYSSRQVLRPKNRAKGTSETHRQHPPPPRPRPPLLLPLPLPPYPPTPAKSLSPTFPLTWVSL